MQYEWNDIKDHLSRILDDEVRIFTDSDLNRLEEYVMSDDDEYQIIEITRFLKNSKLKGELLEIYAQRLSDLLGKPIPLHTASTIPIYELSAWATNPNAKTFELGW